VGQNALVVEGPGTTIDLVGDNILKGASGNTAFYLPVDVACTITSSSSGTLTCSNGDGLIMTQLDGSALSIEGNADVLVIEGSSGLYMGVSSQLSVGENASVTVAGYLAGAEVSGGATLISDGSLRIVGNSTGAKGIEVNSGSLTMTGTGTIEVVGYNSGIVEIAEPIKVGNDVTIILRNLGVSDFSNSFTAISPGGYKWLLTDLTLSSGALTDATITVTIAADSMGTIQREAPGPSAPGITGPKELKLNTGYAATSSAAFSLTGYPAPAVSQSTTHGGKITWNATTGKLDIAPGLAAGTYTVILTAANDIEPNASLTFTLTVATAPPAIPSTGDSSPFVAAAALALLALGIVFLQAHKRRRSTER
jgi:LPXTG-motif cell wall-anchored protein